MQDQQLSLNKDNFRGTGRSPPQTLPGLPRPFPGPCPSPACARPGAPKATARPLPSGALPHPLRPRGSRETPPAQQPPSPPSLQACGTPPSPGHLPPPCRSSGRPRLHRPPAALRAVSPPPSLPPSAARHPLQPLPRSSARAPSVPSKRFLRPQLQGGEGRYHADTSRGPTSGAAPVAAVELPFLQTRAAPVELPFPQASAAPRHVRRAAAAPLRRPNLRAGAGAAGFVPGRGRAAGGRRRGQLGRAGPFPTPGAGRRKWWRRAASPVPG